ncbi:MAG: sugar ABC transporter permease [Actinomycetales bacterium]|nr:sugar ABC transporter permease [Tetrasphaera sp.]NLW99868.1 sugar ABC transporter permease [Actinomycetales bacterium]
MSRVKTWLPGLALVSPSIILIAVFVYGLIGQNVWTSLNASTRRVVVGGKIVERAQHEGGIGNYVNLLSSSGYQHALWNLLVLTVVFLAGTMFFGLLWAVLLEKGVRGEGVFRSIYLFPMAVSFIAAGVVWRWLLSPQQGGGAIGLNQLFQKLGLDSLQSSWWSSDSRWNMAAMAIPAIWQLSGYVMALFLAGFRGISEDQREAARIDGASELQLYRHVLFPQLSPIALSALIIIGHMSMKMFDLIYAIAGPNSYVASVPATLMWTQMFNQGDKVMAAVNATILLVIVAVVVVPYLIYTNRTEKEMGR